MTSILIGVGDSRRSEDAVLVAGSRGYGPLRAVLLGGVNGRLVRVMSCPLIIVPRGHETPFGALFGPAATPAS